MRDRIRWSHELEQKKSELGDLHEFLGNHHELPDVIEEAITDKQEQLKHDIGALHSRLRKLKEGNDGTRPDV